MTPKIKKRHKPKKEQAGKVKGERELAIKSREHRTQKEEEHKDLHTMRENEHTEPAYDAGNGRKESRIASGTTNDVNSALSRGEADKDRRLGESGDCQSPEIQRRQEPA